MAHDENALRTADVTATASRADTLSAWTCKPSCVATVPRGNGIHLTRRFTMNHSYLLRLYYFLLKRFWCIAIMVYICPI